MGLINIHNEEDFEGMRRAGILAADILDQMTQFVKPGVTTGDLDEICAYLMRREGAQSATLGYRGFPKSICTSVNHVACHGIPGDKKLEDGDIISIDVTTLVAGWHGDSCRTYFVGDVGVKAKKLTEVAYYAMCRGVNAAQPGATVGDIGWAIQSYVETTGFSVVKDFFGHGIGRIFHGPPNIMPVGRPGLGQKLEPGMFITIEPIIAAGKPDVKVLSDNWTVVTKDRSLTAQFEHTIGITAEGREIFTLSPRGLHKPPYTPG